MGSTSLSIIRTFLFISAAIDQLNV